LALYCIQNRIVVHIGRLASGDVAIEAWFSAGNNRSRL